MIEDMVVFCLIVCNIYLLKRFHAPDVSQARETIGKMVTVKREFVNLLSIILVLKLVLLLIFAFQRNRLIFINIVEILCLIVFVITFSNLLKVVEIVTTFDYKEPSASGKSRSTIWIIYILFRALCVIFQEVNQINVFLFIHSLIVLQMCILANEVYTSYAVIYQHIQALFEGRLKHDQVKKKVGL
jgi:hypothetical protein